MSKTTIHRIAFLVLTIIVVSATCVYKGYKNIQEEVVCKNTTKDNMSVSNVEISSPPTLKPVQAPKPMGALSKTYMDYRAITDKTSKQWKLLQNLTICDDGMIRDDEGYIAAALGSAFGPIGSRYVFTLEGEKELLIIKADQKQDRHTCENNIFGLNNWDIIEFVVDTSNMPVWANGYIYGGNFNNCPEYAGDVLSWTKVED